MSFNENIVPAFRSNISNFLSRSTVHIKEKNNTSISDGYIPMSPSNYKQPPTPEHPPPNAMQAEKCILDRIRPLSQVSELST